MLILMMNRMVAFRLRKHLTLVKFTSDVIDS